MLRETQASEMKRQMGSDKSVRAAANHGRFQRHPPPPFTWRHEDSLTHRRLMHRSDGTLAHLTTHRSRSRAASIASRRYAASGSWSVIMRREITPRWTNAATASPARTKGDAASAAATARATGVASPTRTSASHATPSSLRRRHPVLNRRSTHPEYRTRSRRTRQESHPR